LFLGDGELGRTGGDHQRRNQRSEGEHCASKIEANTGWGEFGKTLCPLWNRLIRTMSASLILMAQKDSDRAPFFHALTIDRSHRRCRGSSLYTVQTHV
jgi:hypothetical protein